MCLPPVFALYRARKFLDRAGSRVTLCVTGGFRDSADIAKALALGADAVALATASLIAIGCQQYRVCHTGRCPVGITTQDPELRKRLDVDQSAQRLADFYAANRNTTGSRGGGTERFPVLIKLIDARDDLSVQVHPGDEDAPGQGKTEAWYIIDCEPGAGLLLGFKRRTEKKIFEKAAGTVDILPLLKKVPVKKGDVFFIPAGTVHAICKGILLAEVQQSSDTTYRLFDYNRLIKGEKRPLHLVDGVRVSSTMPYHNLYCENGKTERLAGARRTALVASPYFSVRRVDVDSVYTDAADDRSFVSLLALEGEGVLACPDCEDVEMKKGECVFIPANCGDFALRGQISVLETRL